MANDKPLRVTLTPRGEKDKPVIKDKPVVKEEKPNG